MRKSFFLVLLILLTIDSAYAQFTSDITQNTRIVTAQKNQLGQRVIPDGSNGVIVVWEDQRNSGSETNRDIYAQRFNQLGVSQWGDSNGLPVAIKPTAERYFDICPDGNGGIIIVWEDYNAAFTSTHIKGQRITNAGAKLWTDTGNVITNEANKQLRPKISFISAGNYYLAYETSEFNSSEVELKVNKLNGNGDRQWGTGIVICNAPANQTDVDVCTASDGGFIVSWRDPRDKLTEFDIYAQKISSAGTILWNANGMVINNARFEQNYQDVFPDNSGGAFFAWTDKRDSIQIDIYAQRVKANGQIAFQNNGIPVCLSPESQFAPLMVSDMKGGIILCWNDFRNGAVFPFNIDIYAQRIDSAGNIKWQANGKNVCDAVLSQNNQQIISDNNYGAILTWDDRRAGTSVYDIYAQRIDSSGSLLWNADDAAVSLAAGNQYEPKPVKTSDGTIICFIDTRNGINNYDLFVQKIKDNGSTIVGIENQNNIAGEFHLSQNFPNPFNPSSVINYRLPQDGFVKLNVYDINGKLVKTLVNGKRAAGSYSVVFEAGTLPSGIYYYMLETKDFKQTKKMVLIK